MEKFLEKHLDKIIWVICGILYTLLAFGIYSHFHKQSFGQSVPNAPAQFETSLAVPQATTDTVATLATGYLLPGTVCLTVDSNTSLSEYECGTASTTDPTLIYNITRGIDTSYGTSSVASNIYPHRVGADVRVTDFPVIQQFSNIFNGTQAITNPILYSGVSTSTLVTNNNYLASVGYVNASGLGPGSFTLPGILQLATQVQLQGGTATSGAYSLVAPSQFFNQTSSATTTVPVTNTSGKLSQGFLDLTQNWSFSGLLGSSGTTTLATTTISQLTTSGNIITGGSLTTTGNVSIATSTKTETLTLSGNSVDYGQYYSNPVSAATTTISTIAYTIDLNNGNLQSFYLSTSTTLTINNIKAGGRYLLAFQQDGTGSRTITWPASMHWSGALAPTLTLTGKQFDIVSLACYSSSVCFSMANTNFAP